MGHVEIKVLDFRMTKSLAQSETASWARITSMIRNQARDAYCRDLAMAQRIKYVHVYMLAKLLHVAQIIPPHKNA
jgi:hypothetical protein